MESLLITPFAVTANCLSLCPRQPIIRSSDDQKQRAAASCSLQRKWNRWNSFEAKEARCNHTFALVIMTNTSISFFHIIWHAKCVFWFIFHSPCATTVLLCKSEKVLSAVAVAVFRRIRDDNPAASWKFLHHMFDAQHCHSQLKIYSNFVSLRTLFIAILFHDNCLCLHANNQNKFCFLKIKNFKLDRKSISLIPLIEYDGS